VRPGRAADISPPSGAAVMEEYSYTSTHPQGHTGPVTGSLYLYLYCGAFNVASSHLGLMLLFVLLCCRVLFLVVVFVFCIIINNVACVFLS